MNHRTKWILSGAVVVAALGIGSGIAVAGAGSDDDPQPPIPPGALERASALALEHTRGGTVTETEVGDEEGYYEVEVTKDDGTQVDVHLDRDFTVIDSQADGKGDDGSE